MKHDSAPSGAVNDVYFRAFTGAVTLKPGGAEPHPLHCLDFRAFTGAVTLKQRGSGSLVIGDVDYFRAFTGAVTLKLGGEW